MTEKSQFTPEECDWIRKSFELLSPKELEGVFDNALPEYLKALGRTYQTPNEIMVGSSKAANRIIDEVMKDPEFSEFDKAVVASRCVNKKHEEEAVRILTKIIAENDDVTKVSRAYALLAHIAMMNGDEEKQKKYLKVALLKDPNNAEAKIRLADNMLMEIRDKRNSADVDETDLEVEEAEKEVIKLLREGIRTKNPDLALGYMDLGEIMQAKNKDEAEKLYRELYQIDNSEYVNIITFLFAEKRDSEATEVALDAAKNGYPKALGLVGRQYLMGENLDKAAEFYELAIQEGDRSSLVGLGVVKLLKDSTDQKAIEMIGGGLNFGFIHDATDIGAYLAFLGGDEICNVLMEKILAVDPTNRLARQYSKRPRAKKSL